MTTATLPNRFDFDPTEKQLDALESLLIHLDGVYHHGRKPDFQGHANLCDYAEVPMWAQNNVSHIADLRQPIYRQSARSLARAACTLDWKTAPGLDARTRAGK